jgi:hypothetical protein
MTAVNCVLQGKRAYVYADTAHTSLETGFVVGLRSKLLIGKNFPWALASSGQSLSPPVLAAAVDRAMPRNVATFVKALPGLLRECIAALEAAVSATRRWRLPWPFGMRAFVAPVASRSRATAPPWPALAWSPSPRQNWTSQRPGGKFLNY